MKHKRHNGISYNTFNGRFIMRKEADKGHLNIAMIGVKHVPSREGGVEVVVKELSTRMAALGHSVTVFNRKGHHMSGSEYDEKRLESFQGVHLKYVWTIEHRGLAAATSSFSASVRAAFGEYKIVHFHAEGPAFMCWLPKLMGKRVIVTVHGLDHQRAKWGKIASAYIMMGERNAVRYADEIIVLSRNVQKYFKDRYGRETRFIPNGVNRPEIRGCELINKKYGLEKDGYILFLGRIVPEKGLEYLIKAFRKVKTDKKLVIAGGFSDTERFMHRMKAMGSEDDRVIFTDFVQGRTLEELYSNAYVYVLPSDLEGMPLSLLEAMSYGNCCLVSDIPECTEVVEDRAATFRKGDVKDLRSKLQQLCVSHDEVQRYKDGAADFICGKYDWDRVVEETIGVYRGKA